MLPNMTVIHLNNGLLGYFHDHRADKEVASEKSMFTQLGLETQSL